MTNSIQRDNKRRVKFKQNEILRLQYKSIIKSRDLTREIRQQAINKLNKISRNSSKIRIKNRCVLTGRGRAVYRFCKLSRIRLRELAAQGLLAGVKKSSW